MANLKETKKRIGSVKNTQKITRAMKLVSSAKYAKACRALKHAEPFEKEFRGLIQRMTKNQEVSSDLLVEREEKKSLIIIVSSDRGLCGGLNANLLRLAGQTIEKKMKNSVDFDLVLWGKRAILFGNKHDKNVVEKKEKVLEKPSYEICLEKSQEFCSEFLQGNFDRVFVVYSKFENAITQTPTLEQILPINLNPAEEATEDVDYVLEPSRTELLSRILGKLVGSRIFKILLENSASEHAARMSAMDSATNNAEEVISKLTLEYNRARQAAITTELIEITSGAEALN